MIETGKSYWVTLDTARFKVKAIRPAALKGWWFCETEKDLDRIIVPESALTPAD